jgi:hypothetical protein
MAKLLQSGGFTKVTGHRLDRAFLHFESGIAGHRAWSAAAAVAFARGVISYHVQSQEQSGAVTHTAAAAAAAAAPEEEEDCRKSVQQLLADAPEWWNSNELIAAGAVLAAGGPLLSVHQMQYVLQVVDALRAACGGNQVTLFEALPSLAMHVFDI